MVTLTQLLEVLMICTALSMDALVSSFAYGTNKIKIPFSSVLVITLVCRVILAASLLFGRLIGGFLPAGLAVGICSAILLVLGLSKIFDSAVKAIIRRHNGIRKKIRFSFFSLGFILSIYADPEEADQDQSRILTAAEAAALAVALSLDGVAVGFGAGISDIAPLLLLVCSLATDMAGVLIGCRLGNRIAKKTSLDLTWLSGVLLIFLAGMKFL